MDRPAFLFGCGVLAVAIAGVGEALIRTTDHSGWGRVLYLLAIALFARGAWPLPERVESSPEAPGGSPAAEVSHDESRGRRRGLTL
ncbi:MAG: hypothetical protein ABI610_07960, partial [Acidobacteriota bacterium]